MPNRVAHSAPARTKAVASPPPPDALRSDERQSLLGAVIMMVDDEPLAMEVARLHLEDAGYTNFIAVTDASQSLAILADAQPDILLLDLSMPGLTGFEILERMESAHILKDVPTIVLTASTTPATKLQALRLGATEFLTKPVDPSELVSRVRNTLAAKVYWQGLSRRRKQ